MIIETKKGPIGWRDGVSRHSMCSPSEWAEALTKEYPGGDILEWIVQSKLVIAPTCEFFKHVGWGIMGAFTEQEVWGSQFTDDQGWLSVPGGYRIKLSVGLSSLTVRKGNDYGRIIDGYRFNGDWGKVGEGLSIAGINNLPYPVSVGRVAAGLLDKYVGKAICNGIPKEVFQLAWQAGKGSRMEALTLGTFTGFAYDLSSAFPWEASQLPSSRCEWHPGYNPDAFYAFAEIEADIPEDLIAGPIGVRTEDIQDSEMHMMYPVGRIHVTVSQPEMQLLTDMGIAFIVIQGWWADGGDFHPFAELMGMLWNLRDYDKAGAKSLSVACVGQLGSVPEKVGDEYVARAFVNPVYYSHIYAATRCRIYRKALEVGLENVHAFCIDGIITSTPAKVESNGGFGAWREESQGTYFLANDYFKDRPEHDDHRWRSTVEATPVDVAPAFFQENRRTYIDLGMAMNDASCEQLLGQYRYGPVKLPLGSSNRVIPSGLTRQDYLKESICTTLKPLALVS